MGTTRTACADALRDLSRDFDAGRVTEAEFEARWAELQQPAMRPTPRPALERAPGHAPAANPPAPRPVGRRGPDRRSQNVERRRRHAAHGWMPPGLACRFTLAEQAVLAVVAKEVGRTGRCELAVGHIAALAGVSASSVRNALKEARKLLLVRVEERRVSAWRNDTNVVRVTSAEWNVWIARRSGGGFKRLQSTDTKILEKGFSREKAASTAPARDPGPCESRSRPRKTRSA